MCGTVAGNDISDSASPYNGHGSAAKIAFFDLEDSKTGYLTIPSDLADLFSPAYKAGARIHSNSWGGAYNVYDDESIAIDDFLVNHDDFIVLFAAGWTILYHSH